MAGDDHFGPKRQYYAKLLIEVLVLLANESRTPKGFHRCNWERGATINVVVNSWEDIVAFIKQEKFRGYDRSKLPSPTRYAKELFNILKQLKPLGLAEFDKDELSQQGTKSGGIQFSLVNLPSRSHSRIPC